MDTTTLDWEKLESHAKQAPDLMFSIQKARPKRCPERLQFSLSRTLAEKVGFTPATMLALFAADGPEGWLYKLQVVANDGSGNRLTQKSKNRLLWTMPNTGGVAEKWSYQPCSQQPLEVVAAGNGCLVFREPEYVEEGEGEG